MKKTTLWLAMVGALGLAGCGGGGGDSSGGGTTPPEPQPRALPEAGVYLPVLMDAQGQLINRPVDNSYHAVGFVYPTTSEGTQWVNRIDENNSSVNTYAFLYGSSSSDKAKGYPVELEGYVIKNGAGRGANSSEPDSNVKLSKRNFSNQSLWVLDYRKASIVIDQAAFLNWGGQIALQPMATDKIAAGVHWYYRGVNANSQDLFDYLTTQTSSNGQGIKLDIHFVGESCVVTGETESNSKGMNKLTLTGWDRCVFAPTQPIDGKVYEKSWKKDMANFANRNASVTAYLTMKPGNSNGQKDTLMIGIPEITGITPFVVEVQPL